MLRGQGRFSYTSARSAPPGIASRFLGCRSPLALPTPGRFLIQSNFRPVCAHRPRDLKKQM